MYWARKISSHPMILRTPVASRDAFLPIRSEEMAPNTEPTIAPTGNRACKVRGRDRVREREGGRGIGREGEKGEGRRGLCEF